MAIVFALLSSLVYGAGDFFGGLAARRVAPLVVGFVTHAVVVVPMLLIASLIAAPTLRHADLVWGGAAAIAGGIGVILLYRGLASGPMSIVSPITAVVAASIPVLVGAVTDKRPTSWQFLGIALALVAIVAMTRASSNPDDLSRLSLATALTAVTAGVGFGFFLVGLGQTSSGSGLWPIAVGRVCSSVFFGLLVLSRADRRSTARSLPGRVSGLVNRHKRSTNVTGTLNHLLTMETERGRRPRDVRLAVLVLVAGAADVGANTLYLLAVRRGSLAIVGVLSSLYPASTVLLAGFALHERMNRSQRAGLVLAAVAVSLVVAG